MYDPKELEKDNIEKLLHLCRRFNPRRECTLRMYSYLIPVDVIGVKNSFTSDEVDHHLSDFNEILKQFEVKRALPLFLLVSETFFLLFLLLFFSFVG